MKLDGVSGMGGQPPKIQFGGITGGAKAGSTQSANNIDIGAELLRNAGEVQRPQASVSVQGPRGVQPNALQKAMGHIPPEEAASGSHMEIPPEQAKKAANIEGSRNFVDTYQEVTADDFNKLIAA